MRVDYAVLPYDPARSRRANFRYAEIPNTSRRELCGLR